MSERQAPTKWIARADSESSRYLILLFFFISANLAK